MSTENKNAEAGFEIEEIEDAQIIIKAKGKHWSVISNGEKISREEATEYRKALAIALIGMQAFIVVTPALEDVDPAYAKRLADVKVGDGRLLKLCRDLIELKPILFRITAEGNSQINTKINEIEKLIDEILPAQKPESQGGLNTELKKSEIF